MARPSAPVAPNVSAVHPGASAPEVELLLGRPNSYVQYEDGGRLATYEFLERRWDVNGRWLPIRYDAAGKVEKILPQIPAEHDPSSALLVMGRRHWGGASARGNWHELLDEIDRERLSREASGNEPSMERRTELWRKAGEFLSRMTLPAQLKTPAEGEQCCRVLLAVPGGMKQGAAFHVEIPEERAQQLLADQGRLIARPRGELSEELELVLTGGVLSAPGVEGSFVLLGDEETKAPAASSSKDASQAPAESPSEEPKEEPPAPPHPDDAGGRVRQGLYLGFSFRTGDSEGPLLAGNDLDDDNAGFVLGGFWNAAVDSNFDGTFQVEWDHQNADLFFADFGSLEIVTLLAGIRLSTDAAAPMGGFLTVSGGYNINMWNEHQQTCLAVAGPCRFEMENTPAFRVGGGFWSKSREDNSRVSVEFAWKYNTADVRYSIGGGLGAGIVDASSFFMTFSVDFDMEQQ